MGKRPTAEISTHEGESEQQIAGMTLEGALEDMTEFWSQG